MKELTALIVSLMLLACSHMRAPGCAFAEVDKNFLREVLDADWHDTTPDSLKSKRAITETLRASDGKCGGTVTLIAGREESCRNVYLFDEVRNGATCALRLSSVTIDRDISPTTSNAAIGRWLSFASGGINASKPSSTGDGFTMVINSRGKIFNLVVTRLRDPVPYVRLWLYPNDAVSQ